MAALAARLGPYGAIGSLSQAVLRLTTPGVPDLYQGTEFWDLSLVDPDNRRPVDFAARDSALQAGAEPAELLAAWHDGRVKLSVIHRVLALRSRAPDLFGSGAYLPLKVEGPRGDHILAFARVHGQRAAIVVVTRCPGVLALEGEVPLVQAGAWDQTLVQVPSNMLGKTASNVLSNVWRRELPAYIEVADLLQMLPVAVLEVR